MDTTHCIDNKTWQHYALGKTSAEELHAIEAHAATCELCMDIKDGIDAMPNPALLANTVYALNQQAEAYLRSPQKRKLSAWYWSAAAILLLSTVLGIYTFTTKNPAVVVAETPPFVLPDTTTKPQQETTNGSSSLPLQQEKAGAEPTRKQDIIYIDSATPSTIISYDDVPNQKENVDTSLLITDNTENIANSGDDTNLPSTITFSHARKENSNFKAPAAKFTLPAPLTNNNNFNNNNSNFRWENDNSKTKELADSAMYSQALKIYNDGNYDSCLKNLEGFTETSVYYEEALLLKAKIYIEQNNTIEAKKVLNTLVLLNGKRRSEAEKLLQKIK